MSKVRVDTGRRKFLITSTGVLGGIGATFTAGPFVSSWWPSAKAQAEGAPVELDVSQIEYGQMVTVTWRGKPVWVVRRTPEVVKALIGNNGELRDPNSEVLAQQPEYAQNLFRSILPEFLVLIGVCTHLGCSPKYKPKIGELSANWPGGFYCPCHGSTFDLAGRVFKGVPAPINLEVPPHTYKNDHRTLIVGVDHDVSADSAKDA